MKFMGYSEELAVRFSQELAFLVKALELLVVTF